MTDENSDMIIVTPETYNPGRKGRKPEIFPMELIRNASICANSVINNLDIEKKKVLSQGEKIDQYGKEIEVMISQETALRKSDYHLKDQVGYLTRQLTSVRLNVENLKRQNKDIKEQKSLIETKLNEKEDSLHKQCIETERIETLLSVSEKDVVNSNEIRENLQSEIDQCNKEAHILSKEFLSEVSKHQQVSSIVDKIENEKENLKQTITNLELELEQTKQLKEKVEIKLKAVESQENDRNSNNTSADNDTINKLMNLANTLTEKLNEKEILLERTSKAFNELLVDYKYLYEETTKAYIAANRAQDSLANLSFERWNQFNTSERTKDQTSNEEHSICKTAMTKCDALSEVIKKMQKGNDNTNVLREDKCECKTSVEDNQIDMQLTENINSMSKELEQLKKRNDQLYIDNTVHEVENKKLLDSIKELQGNLDKKNQNNWKSKADVYFTEKENLKRQISVKDAQIDVHEAYTRSLKQSCKDLIGKVQNEHDMRVRQMDEYQSMQGEVTYCKALVARYEKNIDEKDDVLNSSQKVEFNITEFKKEVNEMLADNFNKYKSIVGSQMRNDARSMEPEQKYSKELGMFEELKRKISDLESNIKYEDRKTTPSVPSVNIVNNLNGDKSSDSHDQSAVKSLQQNLEKKVEQLNSRLDNIETQDQDLKIFNSDLNRLEDCFSKNIQQEQSNQKEEIEFCKSKIDFLQKEILDECRSKIRQLERNNRKQVEGTRKTRKNVVEECTKDKDQSLDIEKMKKDIIEECSSKIQNVSESSCKKDYVDNVKKDIIRKCKSTIKKVEQSSTKLDVDKIQDIILEECTSKINQLEQCRTDVERIQGDDLKDCKSKISLLEMCYSKVDLIEDLHKNDISRIENQQKEDISRIENQQKEDISKIENQQKDKVSRIEGNINKNATRISMNQSKIREIENDSGSRYLSMEEDPLQRVDRNELNQRIRNVASIQERRLSQLDNRQSRLDNRTSQLDNRTSQLDTRTGATLEAFEERISKLQQQFNRKTKKQKNTTHNNNNRNLVGNIEQMRQQLERNTVGENIVKPINSVFEQERQKLDEEIKQLKAKVSHQTSLRRDDNLLIKGLKRTVSDLKFDNKTLVDEKKELEKKIKSLERDIKDLEAKHKSLEERFSEERVRALKYDADQKDQTIASLISALRGQGSTQHEDNKVQFISTWNMNASKRNSEQPQDADSTNPSAQQPPAIEGPTKTTVDKSSIKNTQTVDKSSIKNRQTVDKSSIKNRQGKVVVENVSTLNTTKTSNILKGSEKPCASELLSNSNQGNDDNNVTINIIKPSTSSCVRDAITDVSSGEDDFFVPKSSSEGAIVASKRKVSGSRKVKSRTVQDATEKNSPKSKGKPDAGEGSRELRENPKASETSQKQKVHLEDEEDLYSDNDAVKQQKMAEKNSPKSKGKPEAGEGSRKLMENHKASEISQKQKVHLEDEEDLSSDNEADKQQKMPNKGKKLSPKHVKKVDDEVSSDVTTVPSKKVPQKEKKVITKFEEDDSIDASEAPIPPKKSSKKVKNLPVKSDSVVSSDEAPIPPKKSSKKVKNSPVKSDSDVSSDEAPIPPKKSSKKVKNLPVKSDSDVSSDEAPIPPKKSSKKVKNLPAKKVDDVSSDEAPIPPKMSSKKAKKSPAKSDSDVSSDEAPIPPKRSSKKVKKSPVKSDSDVSSDEALIEPKKIVKGAKKATLKHIEDKASESADSDLSLGLNDSNTAYVPTQIKKDEPKSATSIKKLPSWLQSKPEIPATPVAKQSSTVTTRRSSNESPSWLQDSSVKSSVTQCTEENINDVPSVSSGRRRDSSHAKKDIPEWLQPSNIPKKNSEEPKKVEEEEILFEELRIPQRNVTSRRSMSAAEVFANAQGLNRPSPTNEPRQTERRNTLSPQSSTPPPPVSMQRRQTVANEDISLLIDDSVSYRPSASEPRSVSRRSLQPQPVTTPFPVSMQRRHTYANEGIPIPDNSLNPAQSNLIRSICERSYESEEEELMNRCLGRKPKPKPSRR